MAPSPRTRPIAAEIPRSTRGPVPFARALGAAELFIGATAVAGGVLLAIRPDGSLMAADPAVLRGTPFADWRVPGLLLASLVGGGFLATGVAELRRARAATALSLAAGAGLAAFEAVQFRLIGAHVLQGVMAAAGLGVVALALARAGRRRRPAPGDRRDASAR